MTKIRAHPVSALLFSFLISSGCSPAVTDPSVSDATAPIPRTAPSIIGLVTAIALPAIIVEEKPTEAHGSAKARVGITDGTQVLRRGEEAVGAAELRVGQQVKVWFTGPVMESYPLQATAGVIVIEPSGR
ncbi:MAG: DUF3221 domain-containing protein [Betaproteobacteria bacterium]|nr:DUF3221 domain-containing protein [Betaproteobacteria bacterium]